MIMRKSATCTLNNSLPHKGTEGTKEYIYIIYSEKRLSQQAFLFKTKLSDRKKV